MPSLRIEATDSFFYTTGGPQRLYTLNNELLVGGSNGSCIGFDKSNLSIFDNSTILSFKMVFTAKVIDTSSGVGVFVTSNTVDNKNPDYRGSVSIIGNGDNIINIINGLLEIAMPLPISTMKMAIQGTILLGMINGYKSVFYSTREPDVTKRPYILVEYGTDNTPSECNPIFPDSTLIDGNIPNEFRWSYSQILNAEQSHFDLQYSTNKGVSWIGLANKTASSEHKFIVSSNALTASNIQWRVRTYSLNGTVASAWSRTANVMIKSAPTAPNITAITNQSRPVVTWISSNQSAVKIELSNDSGIVYQTGVIALSEKRFKFPDYLENGNYTLKLSIINGYGLESAPTSVPFMISAEKPPATTITAASVEYGSKILIAPNASSVKSYILRNNIPIKKITNQTEWIDYNASGTNSYVVRSIDENDNFADSDLIWATTAIKGAVIAPITDTSYILELKVRRNNPITQRGTVDLSGSPKYFAGREFPVFVFSQNSSETKEFLYTFRTKAEFEKFKHIVSLRKTILYRDSHGEKFFGVISSYEFDSDKHGTDVSFNLLKVDCKEEIEYDMEV